MANNEIAWVQATSYTGANCILNEEPASGAGADSANIANQTALDRWGMLRISLDFSSGTPATTGPLEIYTCYSVDAGSTWETGYDATSQPQSTSKVCDVVVDDNAAATEYVSPMFPLRPYMFRVVIWNSTGEAIATDGLDADLYTFNEEIE